MTHNFAKKINVCHLCILLPGLSAHVLYHKINKKP